MQYTVALLLTFMLGVVPMAMPDTPDAQTSSTPPVVEASIVQEELTQPEEAVEEAAAVAVEEAAEEPAEEVAEEVPAGPTVDGAAWTSRFEELWYARHDMPIEFIDPETLVDWDVAYNLAYGTMADAISVEIFQIFTELGEYWFEANLHRNYVPALRVEEFEKLFYDAIEISALVERKDITVGYLHGLMSSIREQLGYLQEPGADPPEANYFFDDYTFVSLWYDAEDNILRCRICYEF